MTTVVDCPGVNTPLKGINITPPRSLVAVQLALPRESAVSAKVTLHVQLLPPFVQLLGSKLVGLTVKVGDGAGDGVGDGPGVGDGAGDGVADEPGVGDGVAVEIAVGEKLGVGVSPYPITGIGVGSKIVFT